MGYITAKSIVDELLLAEDAPDSWYSKYLIHCLNAIRELSYDILATPKTVILPILPNGTIEYPVGYVNWTKVGKLGTDGLVHNLGVNNKICTDLPVDACGNETRPHIAGDERHPERGLNGGLWGYTYFNYYQDGVIGNLFGIGGGYNIYGHFKNDKTNNRFVFASDAHETQIVIEYITNGVSDKGKTMVDELAKMAVIAFIRVENAKARGKESDSTILRMTREFEAEKRTLMKRQWSFTLPEFSEMWSKGFYQAPKY